MDVNYRIEDGERLREDLAKLMHKLPDLGIGDLIKISHHLAFTMYWYEHPTIFEEMFEVGSDDPEYLSSRDTIKRTLDRVYEELNGRGL